MLKGFFFTKLICTDLFLVIVVMAMRIACLIVDMLCFYVVIYVRIKIICLKILYLILRLCFASLHLFIHTFFNYSVQNSKVTVQGSVSMSQMNISCTSCIYIAQYHNKHREIKDNVSQKSIRY